MTEDEARAWLNAQFDVSRETWAKLEAYVAMLLAEADEQNLIAESTKGHVWARHIVDSAQLLTHTASIHGEWIDLGAGAGLPGIVIACLRHQPICMVESRRKRIEFLEHVIAALRLPWARIYGGRVEQVPVTQASIISARAYAPLPKLLQSALHLADKDTIWVLPKGRNAENELEAARSAWQGMFHVEPSVTDSNSAIIIAHDVRPAGKRKHRS